MFVCMVRDGGLENNLGKNELTVVNNKREVTQQTKEMLAIKVVNKTGKCVPAYEFSFLQPCFLSTDEGISGTWNE